MTPSIHQPVQPWDAAGRERRRNSRFAMMLDVRYRFLGDGKIVETGFGRSIDLSCSGLSFTTDRPLSPGRRLVVSIDWPVPHEAGAPLQLIVFGSVVRNSEGAAAIRIYRHEFKTRNARLSVVGLR